MFATPPMYFADSSRGRPRAKDPAVVWFGGRYLLYYSLAPYRDGRTPDGWSIGIAESADLDHWRVVGEVLPAPGDAHEANGICAPAALVWRGEVHLFYQTYGNASRDAICHAASSDGLTFRRNPTNPVFRASGAWNNGRAIDADVLLHGETAFLCFATRDPEGQVQQLGAATAALPPSSHADAADVWATFGHGAWTQYGDGPILAPELLWERRCIEAPAACLVGGRFYLFYAGAYNNEPQQVGCAVSDDGLRWHRLSDEPFLRCGQPGEWNASESGHPFVFTDPNAPFDAAGGSLPGPTHLFFQGNADHGASWYLSYVRLRWTRHGPELWW